MSRMVWVSFKSDNRWSKYLWIHKNKEFLQEAKEFIKEQAELEHPNEIPDQDFIASSYVRDALTKIGLGYEPEPNKSLADWFNTAKAICETVRVVENEMLDEPTENNRYELLSAALKLEKKGRLPKRDLSDISKLQKMASYNKRKS